MHRNVLRARGIFGVFFYFFFFFFFFFFPRRIPEDLISICGGAFCIIDIYVYYMQVWLERVTYAKHVYLLVDSQISPVPDECVGRLYQGLVG